MEENLQNFIKRKKTAKNDFKEVKILEITTKKT